MDGTRKKRPCERWTDLVQEDLGIMGITNRQAIVRDRWELGTIMLETTAHSGLCRLRRRRRRERRWGRRRRINIC